MNAHHKGALATIAAASLLDVALGACYGVTDHIGVLHGLYCATATATTVGCDIAPHGWAPYVLSTVMLLSIVPLFAATFALFTSGLADVSGAEERIKRHVNGALRHHLTKGAAVDPPK